MPTLAEIAEYLRGAGETAATIGSGAIAQPLSGLAGLSRIDNPDQAAQIVQAVQDALTYRPRSNAGQAATGAIGGVFEWIRDHVNQPIGDAAFNKTGSPTLAALAYASPDAILSLLGAKGLGAEGAGLPRGGLGFSERGAARAAKKADPYVAEATRMVAEGKWKTVDRAADGLLQSRDLGDDLMSYAAREVLDAGKPRTATEFVTAVLRKVDEYEVSDGNAPRIAQPVQPEKSARAAKNVKREAMGAIDFASMAPLERQAAALRDVHLKQMPDGKYVGSPDITSPAQLGKLRQRLYSEMKSVLEKPWATDYAPWYERQRAGITEVAGADPVKQHNMASGTGIYSPQATPDVNFTAAANQMQHQAYTGETRFRERTQRQADNFGKQLEGQGDAKLGPKTRNFANSSDPTRFEPDMATNDIWVGRFLGYDGGDFKRGFTAQEHAFVQGELQRMTAIANREKWGGKADWHVEEMQALPWIEYKAQSLVKKRKSMSYDEAVGEAMRTTLEAQPRNTAYLNQEVVPGAATRNLDTVRTGSPELKTRYTQEEGNFLSPEGRNVFVQSLPNSLERQALPFRGQYVNSAGQLENNAGIAFRPMFERSGGKAGPGVRDTSANALDAISGLTGMFNAQEITPWAAAFPHGPGVRIRDLNSAILAKQGGLPLTADEIAAARALGGQHGIPDVTDLGDGRALLTSFSEKSPPPFMNSKYQQKLSEVAHGQGLNPTFTKRVGSGAFLDNAWAQPEGSGAVVGEVLKMIDKSPEQGAWLLENFDKNPAVFEHIMGGFNRDARYAAETGGQVRADLQKLRNDVVNRFGSLQAFFDYVRKNGAAGYPAVMAAPLAPSLFGESEQTR